LKQRNIPNWLSYANTSSMQMFPGEIDLRSRRSNSTTHNKVTVKVH
jgi:hypothetical protein